MAPVFYAKLKELIDDIVGKKIRKRCCGNIQGGRKVLHQKIFTGRGGCREQCEVGYPCPDMNSNAATSTFLCKLGNASDSAPFLLRLFWQ